MISDSAWKRISMFFFQLDESSPEVSVTSFEERQEILKTLYGFECHCHLCKKESGNSWQKGIPTSKYCKISEFIPSSKTSTKKLSIITLQKLKFLLRFCNLYHNQMKLKDVCLEGCENSSKDYLSKNPYLVI